MWNTHVSGNWAPSVPVREPGQGLRRCSLLPAPETPPLSLRSVSAYICFALACCHAGKKTQFFCSLVQRFRKRNGGSFLFPVFGHSRPVRFTQKLRRAPSGKAQRSHHHSSKSSPCLLSKYVLGFSALSHPPVYAVALTAPQRHHPHVQRVTCTDCGLLQTVCLSVALLYFPKSCNCIALSVLQFYIYIFFLPFLILWCS